MASRRNYDIAQGTTIAGEWTSGVLESSWRLGGATAAELLAIQAFLRNDADLKKIRVTHVEEFGEICLPPDGALYILEGRIPWQDL